MKVMFLRKLENGPTGSPPNSSSFSRTVFHNLSEDGWTVKKNQHIEETTSEFFIVFITTKTE